MQPDVTWSEAAPPNVVAAEEKLGVRFQQSVGRQLVRKPEIVINSQR